MLRGVTRCPQGFDGCFKNVGWLGVIVLHRHCSESDSFSVAERFVHGFGPRLCLDDILLATTLRKELYASDDCVTQHAHLRLIAECLRRNRAVNADDARLSEIEQRLRGHLR